MATVAYERSGEIPVIRDVDVAVCGGGPGGIGAAVMAARAGVKTLLIERFGLLGGMASVGEVHPFMPNHHDKTCLDKPVYLEWTRAAQRYLPDDIKAEIPESDEAFSNKARSINREGIALGAEDLCLEAGVDLLYHHTLVDVIVENRLIQYLVLHSKSGFVAVKANIFVDCSGDADLAARAGCDFELGDEQGNCQPMTTCFKLSHVTTKGMEDWHGPWRKTVQKLYEEAKASGELSCPRDTILMFDYYDQDIVHFNTTRVCGKNGTDGPALSEAEIEGRKQIREYISWLRSKVPGFENARLHSMATHIGVRETRRVKGLAYLTREDFVQRSKFEDAIARCNYPIDIHSPTGGATELVHMPRSEFYEIPYGCIVPKDIDNLTVGGRPISVDVAIHSSERVMPPACSLGQAAGLAAAMAVETGMFPAALDGKAVRRRLVEAGAYL